MSHRACRTSPRKPLLRRFGALALPLIAASAAACSSSSPQASERVGAAGQDLYGLGSVAAPWPSGTVPVCFSSTTAYPDLQALLASTLANSWSRAANITFTGFGACSGAHPEVTVTFVPQAQLGPNVIGVTDNLGYGYRSVQLLSDDASPGKSLFLSASMHEFGHVLGFAHEMQRPDNWSGGVALNCPPAANANNANQYQPITGGANLTTNYDPNSVMNYCSPQKTLSVGDILGVSASVYGPSACAFTDTATQCTWTYGLHAEETFSIPGQCPSTSGWTLQWQSPSGWVNVPNSCTGGAQSGTCGAAAVNPNSFTLGWQAEGVVGSGPAIASTQRARMCDPLGNCGAPFNLTVADCHTQSDSLYLSPGNDPMQVQRGTLGAANILLVGPWVQSDLGSSAGAQAVGSPIPGAAIGFANVSTSNGAAIQMTVSTTMSTPPGNYTVQVSAYDSASGVTRGASLAVEVLDCAPLPASQVCAGVFARGCGLKFASCGGTVDCGMCDLGSYCSAGFCCALGTTFDEATNTCQPNTCPAGTSVCPDTGTCLTAKACARAGGHCTGRSCN